MVKNRFGSVWYTIYHHSPVVIGGKQTPLLINQPMGKGHLCHLDDFFHQAKWWENIDRKKKKHHERYGKMDEHGI